VLKAFCSIKPAKGLTFNLLHKVFQDSVSILYELTAEVIPQQICYSLVSLVWFISPKYHTYDCALINF